MNEEPSSKSLLCCNWKSDEQACEEEIINPIYNAQYFI